MIPASETVRFSPPRAGSFVAATAARIARTDSSNAFSSTVRTTPAVSIAMPPTGLRPKPPPPNGPPPKPPPN